MPADQLSRRRLPIWPFIVLAILLIIAGTGYYFYTRYFAQNRWKPILQQRLKELILRSSDSLYHIEYSDFDLNITSGDATLKDFTLSPDTEVYNRLVLEKKAPDNLFILKVKKLSIKNIGAKKAYQERILEINNISIEKPDLTVINKRLYFNDTVKVGKPKTPYQIIKKVFKKLHIDSILLKDISLQYINKNRPKIRQTALRHLDIHIGDIVVDSLSSKDTSRFYYTRGVTLTLHGYRLATPDSLYYLKLKQLYFSTSQKKIIIDHPQVEPRYSKKEFYRKIQRSADRFDIDAKRLSIDGIDLQRFLRYQDLHARKMDITNADVEIYHDNAYKGRKTLKTDKDPHQQLQNVALDMTLDRLNLFNATIKYAEADVHTGYTGVIIFNSTNGHFLNVTNDNDQKKKAPVMYASINTRFMNAANLHVNFKFNLISPTGEFNYNGKLGRFDGRILDKLVKPLALVHVKSADVEKLTFNVNANNYFGRGNLNFYYKNLNIELLKKEEGKAGLQKQGLISTLANELIINDSNPDRKGHFHPGPISLKRDPDVSFFSFLYKALLDGLKPSVGYDEKTENKVNKAITKVTGIINTFKEFKEKRKERRDERRKKREEKKLEKAANGKNKEQ